MVVEEPQQNKFIFVRCAFIHLVKFIFVKKPIIIFI